MVIDLHGQNQVNICKGLGNKRTMMVLYRSPEYKAVQVNNEDKYQIDY